MDMAKAGRLLKVCSLVAQMPSGGGLVRPSFIVEWSAVPHATAYRYLPKLAELGYLERTKLSYRNGVIFHYTITQAGNDYLKAFKEMF